MAGQTGHTIDAEATARANAVIISGDLIPGAVSTPDDTSTTAGCNVEIARATLSGFRPPARTIGMSRPISIARDAMESQSNARPVPPDFPRTLVSRSSASTESAIDFHDSESSE